MENSPGSTIESVKKDLVFKIPVGTARKRKKKILDDETYVEVTVLL